MLLRTQIVEKYFHVHYFSFVVVTVIPGGLRTPVVKSAIKINSLNMCKRKKCKE